MADTVTYGMGQLRYNERTPYITDLNFKKEQKDVTITSTNDDQYFQDILLSSNNANFSFAYGTSYLLRLEIPKNLSYDNIFRVKLLPKVTTSYINNSVTDFQVIKYIEIPKDTKATSKNSRVILYPVDSSGKPLANSSSNNYTAKVAIAKSSTASGLVNGDVIYDQNTEKYYIYRNSTTKEEIKNKNDQIMNHSWNTSVVTTDIVTYDIVFSPRTSDETYTDIWIEMVRNADDRDIYMDNKYGRRIDFTNFNAKVYEFTNLINSDYLRQISSIEHLGIYSHPNLILAINGEEIRIGQTGYYELNDFEITSLGIAAHSNNDRFTLDYQYKIVT